MVLLNPYSAAQIFVLLVVSFLFQLIMVIRNPMTDMWDQRITWMIEISISIYLYVLLSLTDFMGENTVREELGWVLTMLTGTVVTINVLILFWKSYWRAVAFIKRQAGHIFAEKARKNQY
jgi:hypothetical protein